MQKLKIDIINTPKEYFYHCKPIDLTLNENYISFEMDGYVSERDDEEREYFLEARTISKDCISGVALIYHSENQQFKITIFATGVPEGSDIDLFFAEFEKANEIYKILKLYRFGS